MTKRGVKSLISLMHNDKPDKQPSIPHFHLCSITPKFINPCIPCFRPVCPGGRGGSTSAIREETLHRPGARGQERTTGTQGLPKFHPFVHLWGSFKSSILMGFSIINHPLGIPPFYGNHQYNVSSCYTITIPISKAKTGEILHALAIRFPCAQFQWFGVIGMVICVVRWDMCVENHMQECARAQQKWTALLPLVNRQVVK